MNNREVDVFRDGKWEKEILGNLMVGQIVRVKDGDVMPADMLFVSSENDCYMDISNVNG